eukprot:441538-Rhodomonas_salina.1
MGICGSEGGAGAAWSLGFAFRAGDAGACISCTAPGSCSYSPKSKTRNRIPRTNCTELAVSGIGFRGAPAA